jgi:hypothetical protein
MSRIWIFCPLSYNSQVAFVMAVEGEAHARDFVTDDILVAYMSFLD